MASSTWHLAKNLTLLLTTILLVPFTTLLCVVSSCYSFAFLSRQTQSPTPRPKPSRKTILVTGVSMSKGLTLARHFHRAGHRVIGADFHPLNPGRVSRALATFYTLSRPSTDDSAVEEDEDPYLQALLSIVVREKVDLWVSVSDVQNALQDALAKEVIEKNQRHPCKVIQLPMKETQLLHEKDSFMDHTASLGLRIPDTALLADKDSITEFLRTHGGLRAHPDGKGKRYLVKPVGVDDIARFNMTPLPLSSEAQTISHIDNIPFPAGANFMVQEFIDGNEYCTYSLVVNGKITAFTACPSETVLTSYVALDPSSALFKAMYAFTETQVASLPGNVSGHLSFDFLVKKGEVGSQNRDDSKRDEASEVTLYPIECNPRVHTAVVLFNDTPELVAAYTSICEAPSDPAASAESQVLTPANPKKVYWVGQDVADLVMYPLYCTFFSGTQSMESSMSSLRSFWTRITTWKDGTFEVWDPWPFWWLYHGYWPVEFFRYLFQGKWHRINVSTGKAFKSA